MTEKFSSPSTHPWTFFGLTFLHTWVFWIPAALLSRGPYTAIARILHYAGGLMPAVTALSLLYIFGERAGRQDYWRRIFDNRRIAGLWFAIIYLSVPALITLGVLVDKSLGGLGADLKPLIAYATHPLSILPFAFFILIFGPLPEEIAWRGYALSAILYHFMINFSGELIDMSLRAEAFYIAGLWAVALIAAIAMGSSQLAGKRALSP